MAAPSGGTSPPHRPSLLPVRTSGSRESVEARRQPTQGFYLFSAEARLIHNPKGAAAVAASLRQHSTDNREAARHGKKTLLGKTRRAPGLTTCSQGKRHAMVLEFDAPQQLPDTLLIFPRSSRELFLRKRSVAEEIWLENALELLPKCLGKPGRDLQRVDQRQLQHHSNFCCQRVTCCTPQGFVAETPFGQDCGEGENCCCCLNPCGNSKGCVKQKNFIN